MSLFDEILEGVAEDDREVLAKYPDVKKKIEEADNLVSRWEAWKNQAWDDTANMTKAESEARRELARYQERVAALEALGGEEMGFDNILAELKKSGTFLTKEDLKSLNDPKNPESFVDRKSFETSLQQQAFGTEYFYGSTAHLPVQHKDEFGEVFKLKDLFEYMNKNKIMDPEAAYEKMVAPKRDEARKAAEEAREKDIEAKIEAARSEERTKVLRERGQLEGRLPTDNGTAPVGHLQASAMRSAQEGKEPEIPREMKLGDSRLAQLGYEEYLKNKSVAGPTQ